MKDDIKDTLEEEHGYNEDKDKRPTAHALFANLKLSKRTDGETLEEVRDLKNVITQEGANTVRDTIGGNGGTGQSITALRWTAIGSSATSFGNFPSGDTQLGVETSRKQNVFNTTTNVGQFSNVATFSNMATTVKESGLFNDATTNSGTMLAAQSFQQINLTSSDSLEVQWKVYFSEV